MTVATSSKRSFATAASTPDAAPQMPGPCGSFGHPDGPGSCALVEEQGSTYMADNDTIRTTPALSAAAGRDAVRRRLRQAVNCLAHTSGKESNPTQSHGGRISRLATALS